MARKRRKPDREELRENVLRPSSYLGYDRDTLGVYFLGRGAVELAESQFRRAVWLNPYEPNFKVHWATALIRLKQWEKARELLAEVLVGDPAQAEARQFFRQYWPGDSTNA